jgi:hypothetical protein
VVLFFKSCFEDDRYPGLTLAYNFIANNNRTGLPLLFWHQFNLLLFRFSEIAKHEIKSRSLTIECPPHSGGIFHHYNGDRHYTYFKCKHDHGVWLKPNMPRNSPLDYWLYSRLTNLKSSACPVPGWVLCPVCSVAWWRPLDLSLLFLERKANWLPQINP